MLEKYKVEEPFLYKLLNKAKENKTLSHAYLVDTSNSSSKCDFAIEFSKLFLCPSINNDNRCDECSICSRINNKNFNELNIINPDGLWIKKEQLRNLKAEYSKTSLESKNRVYIINECEKMNNHASNSLLKFLEEPEQGIFAILLTDYPDRILETIKSRCQLIKLRGDKFNNLKKYETVKNQSLLKILILTFNSEEIDEILKNEKYLNILELALKIIESIETNSDYVLIHINKLNLLLEDKKKLGFFLDTMLFFYKDVINLKNGCNVEIYNKYIEELTKIEKLNTEENLISTIKIIVDMKENINYNMNNKLLIDKLVYRIKRR